MWEHGNKGREAQGMCQQLQGFSWVPVTQFMKGNGTKDLNGKLERTKADVK